MEAARIQGSRLPRVQVSTGPLCRAMSDEINCNVTAVHYTGLSREAITAISSRLSYHAVVISLIARDRGASADSGLFTLFFHIFLSTRYGDSYSIIEIRAIRHYRRNGNIHPRALY